MAAPTFRDLVNTMTGDQPPRVWSLLVTVFGDLAQDDGVAISGALLNRITGAIGIKPEATRVALHRLRKEGWIDSHRTGRSSSYALTERGREQSAAASPRIYRTAAAARQAWLIVTRHGSPPLGSGNDGVSIAPHITLSAIRPAADNVLIKELTSQDRIPDWIADRICGADLVALAALAAAQLDRLSQRLPAPDTLGALETATLRVLTVHTWRRIALRMPPLPDHVFPPDWRGPECRERADYLLRRLPPQDLKELERQEASTT